MTIEDCGIVGIPATVPETGIAPAGGGSGAAIAEDMDNPAEVADDVDASRGDSTDAASGIADTEAVTTVVDGVAKTVAVAELAVAKIDEG